MRHSSCVALLLGFSALMLAARAYTQPPSPFVPGVWWKEYQKPLGLNRDQFERIDKIFQDTLPGLRSLRTQLTTEEAELSRLISLGTDERPVIKQSERVESLRASLNHQRTMMLVHMRAILTPEQRAKLNAIRQQWDLDHPQRDRSPTTPAAK